MVIANLYWLREDDQIYQGDDVQRRVEQALKGKPKKKSSGQVLLSIEVRTFLFKEALILDCNDVDVGIM